MRRRDALKLFTLAGLAPACSGHAVSGGLPPWHMWGNTSAVTIAKAGGFQSQSSTEQLAYVKYGRPETWSFFFSAVVTESNVPTPGQAGTVTIDFDLTLGVGRSTVILPSFETYVISVGNGAPPNQTGKMFYSTEVVAPARFIGDTKDNYIAEFPAQQINCIARVTLFASESDMTASVAVSSFFTPKVHFRPEWFENRFPGGETEGH